MQARNGFAVLFRSFTRLIGCSLAVGVVAMAFASGANAAEKETYVGLGDSLAFGYSQQLFNENAAKGENPKGFENGYVNDYASLFRPDATIVNFGCPGETTDSMIGNGPLAKVMSETLGTTSEAPCAYHYVDLLRLHREYAGEGSQLEAALERIKAASVGKPVKVITLDIGANDQLHQKGRCEAEVKHEFETEGKSKYGGSPEEAVKNCLLSHVSGLFKHILTNISGILYVIRHGEDFAPAFGKRGVNYTGKIIVQGGYDAFGAVFTPGVELLPGSNLLVAFLNSLEAKTVAAFGACYANPQATFNPAVIGKPAEEPSQMQKLTNMANFTEFEGKKNGPDIHPTPLGYEELAKIMGADCP